MMGFTCSLKYEENLTHFTSKDYCKVFQGKLHGVPYNCCNLSSHINHNALLQNLQSCSEERAVTIQAYTTVDTGMALCFNQNYFPVLMA